MMSIFRTFLLMTLSSAPYSGFAFQSKTISSSSSFQPPPLSPLLPLAFVSPSKQQQQQNCYRTSSSSIKIKTFSSPNPNDPTTPLILQQPQQQQPPPISTIQVTTATTILTNFDKHQQEFISKDNNQGWGGGTSALHYLQNLSPTQRTEMKEAVLTLVSRANHERSLDSSHGRIMLGFCCANAYEALGGLKSWVSSLQIPRGLLHGMDIDGVPQPLENFGAVYVKYSTGGAMTFSEMRRSGKGFDALWKPGDALLETYDGDFRGVYLNLELEDGVFRQFGVLPTDLFMEVEGEEEWDD